MKELFTVELSIDVVVLAESKEEAEKIVEREKHEIMRDSEIWLNATKLDCLPTGWEKECEPYGGDGQTVGQLIDVGAAPAYDMAMARLRKVTEQV